jgi:hypothetical protein
MKSQRKYYLQNLVEQIERVDKLIKFHSTNHSSFMYDQYAAEKEELLSKLIDKLVTSENRSEYIFQLVYMALKKYYPEIIKRTYRIKSNANYKEYKELANALA